MTQKIYLRVPYSEKEAAKAQGARWDPELKKWYYEGPVKQFPKLGRWILPPDQEEILIAYEHLFLIEGKRTCYRCGKQTTVVGIGVGLHSKLIEDGGRYLIDDPDDCPEMGEEIHLAWFDQEEKIPPLLRNYLKEHYPVKTAYSKVVGSCFANCCQHCGSLQGNNYLFQEAESPLSTETPEKRELIRRMRQLKLYTIYIDEALPLDLDLGYCGNDWAYEQYAKFEDLILSPSGELWTSYAELYGK